MNIASKKKKKKKEMNIAVTFSRTEEVLEIK